jgi:anaerobic magnesium-protoporphyrin IX monomethyl ester cyclase
MRVTLVHPNGHNFIPGQPDLTLLVNRMAPIGISQLCAWLDRRGHPTCLHDCLGPGAPDGTEANAEAILATKPDLVGFSATTSSFLNGYDIASVIKRRRPEIQIVFGAVHASSVGSSLLQHFPAIDFLCLGEGELVLEELAAGEKPAQIGSLVYRDGAAIRTNPRRPRMEDLDHLPFPAYDKLRGFPSGYYLPQFSYVKRHGATMITSRGCPHTCSFCDRTVFEHRYKYHSAHYVWEQMRWLRDSFGVHHITFYDDLFTASRSRTTELCELLIRKPLGMDFNCAIRVGHTSKELLRLLRRAGCLQVSMGIESADPTMIARHKSGVDLDAVRATVDELRRAGIRTKGLFMFGLPGETPDTIASTFRFIQELALDEMNVSKFTPFPGAPIWDHCIANETGSFHEDWRLMNCVNFVFVPSAFNSAAHMDELYNGFMRQYYGSASFVFRFLKRLWCHRWSLWHMVRCFPVLLQAMYYFGMRSRTTVDKHSPLHPLQPRFLSVSRAGSKPSVISSASDPTEQPTGPSLCLPT